MLAYYSCILEVPQCGRYSPHLATERENQAAVLFVYLSAARAPALTARAEPASGWTGLSSVSLPPAMPSYPSVIQTSVRKNEPGDTARTSTNCAIRMTRVTGCRWSPDRGVGEFLWSDLSQDPGCAHFPDVWRLSVKGYRFYFHESRRVCYRC
jgi:hypothetical protein